MKRSPSERSKMNAAPAAMPHNRFIPPNDDNGEDENGFIQGETDRVDVGYVMCIEHTDYNTKRRTGRLHVSRHGTAISTKLIRRRPTSR